MPTQTPLKEIAKVFFRLGVIGFGGPAVHIALMEQEIVKKRKWVSESEFMNVIGTTNLIPGPNSTEITMHFGQEQGGWKGLIVAGFCFITPALITTMLSNHPPAQVAHAQTIFNVVCSLLVLPFARHFSNFIEMLIPHKKS